MFNFLFNNKGEEVKVTETFNSNTIGNLIGGKGKLKSESFIVVKEMENE